MTDYKTMRVPEAAHEAASNAKREDETWGEYLRRCAENPPETNKLVEASDVLDGGASTDGDSLTYEDVESACETAVQAAIRDELR